MEKKPLQILSLALILCCLPTLALAEVCQGFGPQTPRDIDNRSGNNTGIFSFAPPFKEMNLCNIHFHKQAEHKAKDFSVFAGDMTYGGFRCQDTAKLSKKELQPLTKNHCTNIAPGDTIEVHWVHSSCDVSPGAGLGSCLSAETCPNPNLRVEAQVFLVVNDPKALNFMDFDYDGKTGNSYHQAKAIPSGTGTPVQFLGSTTGPSFTEEVCSPLQVTWNVRPQCAKVDISSLSKWCEKNSFGEDHGHGVRQLVTNPDLLAPIGEAN